MVDETNITQEDKVYQNLARARDIVSKLQFDDNYEYKVDLCYETSVKIRGLLYDIRQRKMDKETYNSFRKGKMKNPLDLAKTLYRQVESEANPGPYETGPFSRDGLSFNPTVSQEDLISRLQESASK